MFTDCERPSGGTNLLIAPYKPTITLSLRVGNDSDSVCADVKQAVSVERGPLAYRRPAQVLASDHLRPSAECVWTVIEPAS